MTGRDAEWEAALEGSTGVDARIVSLVQHAIRQHVGAAIAQEREACAKIVDEWQGSNWYCLTCGGQTIAAAIRARSLTDDTRAPGA